MRDRESELAEAYAAALQFYLSDPAELALARAHELGRQALANGLGVLDMATVHSGALAAELKRPVADRERAQIIEGAEKFFVEALSPFEMAHRGFWEANVTLHRLNEVLEGQAKRIASALHNEAAQLLASVHLALADVALRLPPDSAASATPGSMPCVIASLRNTLRRNSTQHPTRAHKQAATTPAASARKTTSAWNGAISQCIMP